MPLGSSSDAPVISPGPRSVAALAIRDCRELSLGRLTERLRGFTANHETEVVALRCSRYCGAVIWSSSERIVSASFASDGLTHFLDGFESAPAERGACFQRSMPQPGRGPCVSNFSPSGFRQNDGMRGFRCREQSWRRVVPPRREREMPVPQDMSRLAWSGPLALPLNDEQNRSSSVAGVLEDAADGCLSCHRPLSFALSRYAGHRNPQPKRRHAA